jgi:hypothetical protein
MNLQQTQLQIEQLKQQMTLTLNNPKSVKLQVKNISLIQKQLQSIKKEMNLAIREINQQATQTVFNGYSCPQWH